MKKEKIGQLSYKGFLTEFFVTPKVKDFFKKNNVSLTKLIPTEKEWYELTLFEKFDEDEDGFPDSQFGKKFSTVYYKIATKKTIESEDKIENDLNDYLKNALLLAASKVFNFEVDYVVVRGIEK